MKIQLQQIKVRDIFDGYVNNDEEGVFAFGGKLAIRPPYQREFVYNIKQSTEVINTVLKGFPLNSMYWVKTGDDTYEVLDGQQRTLSVMMYLNHKFSIVLNGNTYYFDSLEQDIRDKIMNYEFMVYVCEGTPSEKLEWFKIVNIAGEKLTDQERRNSVFTGPWLSDAKRHFSKTKCAASQISDRYIKGTPIRQELLEKALIGICDSQGITDITEYMSAHQNDADADELWQYFQEVISWIVKIFPDYNSDMKGLDWCRLYNTYHGNHYNSSEMRKAVKELHLDEEIKSPKGIYEYLLCKDSDPFAGRFLSLRAFDERDKRLVYSKQNGVCPLCKGHFEYKEMEGDHIVPWSKGGKTTLENLQMLCKKCNGSKSDKY